MPENITATMFSKILKEKVSNNNYDIVYYTYAFVLLSILIVSILISLWSYRRERNDEE